MSQGIDVQGLQVKQETALNGIASSVSACQQCKHEVTYIETHALKLTM